MARFLGGVALAAALVVASAACGSPEPNRGALDLDDAEREIHRLADRVYGSRTDVGAVRCPTAVPIQADLVFVCTVDIDGAPLVFRVRQEDDDRNVRIEQAQAVISTRKMEDFVVAAGRRKQTPVEAASCGESPQLIRNPGKTVRCRVEFDDGTEGVAVLGVRNVGGEVVLLRLGPASG